MRVPQNFTPQNTSFIDHLPTPYGLVLHRIIKHNFAALFDHKNEEEELHYMENVTVGHDVSLQDILDMYHVVVLAYGCESDVTLHCLKNENLEGVMAVQEFVS